MRLVSYDENGAWRSGIEVGSLVADVQRAARHAGWSTEDSAPLHSTRAVLALEADRLRALRDHGAPWTAALEADGIARPRADLRLGPPVPDPPKIICLGL